MKPKNPRVTAIMMQACLNFQCHPYILAHGRCADFKDQASGVLDEKRIDHQLFWDDHLMPDADAATLGVLKAGHVFIRVGGLYYDSLEPMGVEHHLLLPGAAQQIARRTLINAGMIRRSRPGGEMKT